MADIYIDKIVIDNLYFGGVNDFYPSSEEEEKPDTNSGDDEETSSEGCDAVSINTNFMAKSISRVEDIDLDTVKKVLKGAGQFLKAYAEIQNEK